MRPAAAAPSRGAQLSRVGRPAAAPAAAEHPPGQAGASHHALRAGAGPGSAENHELAATRWRPGGPAVAGRPCQASPLPGAVVARTGTGISHRRRRGAVPGRRYPGSRAGNPAALREQGLAQGWVRRGRLLAEAWSCGVPGRALPGRGRGTLDSVRIRGDPRRMRAPGPRRPGGDLLDSRREVPAVPDNIVLIMRFHPVGGEDVTVVSEDFGGEREALEAIAQAQDERRSLVLTHARYGRETGHSGVIINLANVVAVRVSKTDSAATGQYM